MHADVKFAGIAGFRLVTHDADRLARFYAALGFEVDEERRIERDELATLGITGGGTRRPLRVGEARLDLDQFDEPGNAYPSNTDAASTTFQHLALVASDVAGSWAKARAAGAVSISRNGPVMLPPSTGGVTAIKFRDPEGHPLELILFPERQSDGWHRYGLHGIDHSALVASDLMATQAFYAGLSLTQGHATLNEGPTQEALDGLDDVRADVVPMLPKRPGAHVELLHYRTPHRSSGLLWSSRDVAATRIVWVADVSTPTLLRDPDGHFHQVQA